VANRNRPRLVFYRTFLMDHCGLANITVIQITNVDLVNNTISYLIQVRNAPGEMVKTQSLHGIFIANTSEEQPSASFTIDAGYQQSTVTQEPNGSYPCPDWGDLLDSIRIQKLWLNQRDRERLFPKV